MKTHGLLATLALSMLLLLRANGAPAAIENGYSWTIVCVDCPHSFSRGRMTDRALQIDALGQPHVAYGGGQLYYAVRSDNGWQAEVVDPTFRVGSDAALALDTSGQPHISYFDEGNADLRYAFRDAAGWHIETIESQGAVGRDTSITLDSQGYAHISYRNLDTGELRYAFQDGEGWHVETVDDGARWQTSLAMDAQDRPHIAYVAGVGHDLRHAVRDAQGWHVETVDDQNEIGDRLSIAVGPQGRVHIVYLEGFYDDLRYANNDGAGWQLETVDSEGYTGYSTSLAIDSSGRPHISYLRKHFDQDWDEVSHAYRDDAGWHGEIAYQGGNWVDFTSLALDSTDRPCIALSDRDAYQSPASLLLVCRQPDDGGLDAGLSNWAVETIDTEGEIGQESSLTIDALGRPHVAYTGAGLAYAWSTGLPAAGAGEYLAPGWQGELIDSQGAEPSLALDSAGVPRLAYTDVVTQALRYAIRTASGWQMETVDAGASAPSLVLDAGDLPHIGFSSTGGVFYAHRGPEGWQVDLVDPRGGSQVALALTVGNEPRLAYINTSGDLRYAYRVGPVWYSQIVEIAEEAFSGTSLAFDHQGYPHISFSQRYEWENEEFVGVRHAYRDTAGWHIQEVHAGPDLGSKTALAFDRQDALHIASDDGGRVWLATPGVDGWQVEEVAIASRLLFSSLALDPWDRPAIAFYDARDIHGLMLAARGPALDRVWLPLVLR